jgi:hypothetical protein
MRCNNIDECKNSTLNTCHSNATCTDKIPTDDKPDPFKCECKDGYDGDGKKRCVATCKEDGFSCGANEDCLFDTNEYVRSCLCHPGYFRNETKQCEKAHSYKANLRINLLFLDFILL